MSNETNAGLLRRATAYAIDVLFFCVTSILIYLLLIALISDKLLVSILIPLICTLWFSFYFVYFHWKYGQTLGKRIMSIKTVNIDESPMTFGTAFLRWVMTVVSLGFSVVTVFLLFLDKERIILHDKVAKTKVIHTKK